MDLGRCADRAFTNVAGAGFDGDVTKFAHLGFARWRGPWVYTAAVIRALLGFRPPRHMRVEYDGGVFDKPGMLLAVANIACYGGGMRIAPLGPLVTDVAPGYDHITSAIGGAIAGAAGADVLCYVTPSEHLRLPDLEDVREGVIASRIAAHAADIAKGVKGAMEWDREMARRRKALDWNGQIELSINPERSRKLRESSLPKESDVCSMCGEFCSMKGVSKYLKKEPGVIPDRTVRGQGSQESGAKKK